MKGDILFYTFPGQSREVYIGIGKTACIMVEGEQYPLTISLKGNEYNKKLKLAEELAPSEFFKRFPPLQGSSTEIEYKHWIARGCPEYMTKKDLLLRKKVEDYIRNYATHYQIEDIAKMLYIVK